MDVQANATATAEVTALDVSASVKLDARENHAKVVTAKWDAVVLNRTSVEANVDVLVSATATVVVNAKDVNASVNLDARE